MGDVAAVENAVGPSLAAEDRAALVEAVRVLEHPSLAARLSAFAGRPLDLLGRVLPGPVQEAVTRAVEAALKASLRLALGSLRRSRPDRTGRVHKALAAGSGALGGAFGLMSLPLELPVSTTIMLRAIADIARSEGEDLTDPEAALACVQVFALGGRSDAEGLAESGYFAVRGALAKSVTEAARYIAERGLVEEGAPVLVRFAAQIASRFGLVVSQKLAAQAVPVIGALGGAALNAAFTDHFQAIARGHFTVRRLERVYGKDAVRAAYEEIRTAGKL